MTLVRQNLENTQPRSRTPPSTCRQSGRNWLIDTMTASMNSWMRCSLCLIIGLISKEKAIKCILNVIIWGNDSRNLLKRIGTSTPPVAQASEAMQELQMVWPARILLGMASKLIHLPAISKAWGSLSSKPSPALESCSQTMHCMMARTLLAPVQLTELI